MYLILFTHSSIAEMVGGSAMNSHSGGGSLGTSGSIVMATGGGLGGAWGKRIIAVADYTIYMCSSAVWSFVCASPRIIPHSKPCTAELPLRVGLICAIYIDLSGVNAAHMSPAPL